MSARPFAGVRVVELARVPPAELPGAMLAALGADVVKIASPLRAGTDAGYQVDLNRGKRVLALDLKTAAGRASLHELIPGADVVIEGFRPGVTARLGADYGTLVAINPRLVYCSMSAYGQTGPYRDRAGHDINFMALSGALSLIGAPGDAPVLPLNLVADYGGAGLHAAFAIAAALFARERSGNGDHIDVSYLDTTVALLAAVPGAELFTPGAAPLARGQGFLTGTFPYYGVYETADARHLAVGCVEHHFWSRFCHLLGRPDLVDHGPRPGDDRAWPDPDRTRAREAIASILRTRTRDEWWDVFKDEDVCVTPVLDPQESRTNAQVVARDMALGAFAVKFRGGSS